MADTTRAEFNPADMPTTPRHGIKYPGANNLVRFASQQFQAMAESIDDNIDQLPDQITATLTDATRRAEAAATKAEQAAANAGRMGDGAVAGFVNKTDSATRQALDLHYVKVFESPHIVTIGDSYASPTDGRSWAVQLANLLNATLHNYAIAGTGYLTTDATKNYQAQADKAVADKSYDHNRVQYVIVGGSRNDIGDYTAHQTAMARIYETTATSFPNARIIFVPMLWDWKPVGGYWRSNASAIMSGVMSHARAEAIPYAWTWLLGMPERFSGTDIHPDETGSLIIARYIKSYLDGRYTGRYVSQVVKAPNNTGLWALSITASGGTISYSLGVADRVALSNVQSFHIPLWAAASNDMPNDGYPGWSTAITNSGNQAALFHVDHISTQDAGRNPTASAGIQPFTVSSGQAPAGRMGLSFTRAW